MTNAQCLPYNTLMNLDDTLTLLACDPCTPLDVAELALHLARDEYPQVDVEAYLGELAGMAHEAGRYLRGSLKARVTGLCRYLFHEMGFRGNTQDYYNPRNSYLNQVLDRRTGIPITLATVAIAVARRAGLEADGVGLPGHFIARAGRGRDVVLFDPFHGGRILTPTDCEHLVEQATAMPFEATPDNLRPLPAGQMVLRMLTNLKAIYLRASDFARAVRVLLRLRQLAPHDPLQRRDLGVSLLHAGRPGSAIEHLSAYLDAAPKADDAASVRQLLHKARGEVARWN
jgi:regulator of sirC expression with transglutaminase-like and TPR domain